MSDSTTPDQDRRNKIEQRRREFKNRAIPRTPQPRSEGEEGYGGQPWRIGRQR